MKRIYVFCFRHSKIITILSLVLFILSFYLSLNIKVNYDLYSLLPKDLPSVNALNELRNTFKLGEEAYILLPFNDPYEVDSLKKKVSQIKGVSKVLWISDFQDIFLPDYFWDQNIKDKFIKDGYTFLKIEFIESSQSPLTKSAIKEINLILPKGSYFTGNAVIGQDLSELTVIGL